MNNLKKKNRSIHSTSRLPLDTNKQKLLGTLLPYSLTYILQLSCFYSEYDLMEARTSLLFTLIHSTLTIPQIMYCALVCTSWPVPVIWCQRDAQAACLNTSRHRIQYKLVKVEASTRKLPNSHFEIDLPFKYNPMFPSNKNQAYRRFLNVLKKIESYSAFGRDYKVFMKPMVENNFMEKIPEDEIYVEPGRSWYLLHHAVYHKQKEKIRVVFDCSSKYQGISLNNSLWQGPDLANNLFGVLLRFRH